jgi:hypothetical protein
VLTRNGYWNWLAGAESEPTTLKGVQ